VFKKIALTLPPLLSVPDLLVTAVSTQNNITQFVVVDDGGNRRIRATFAEVE
jgi:hypothetical protein